MQALPPRNPATFATDLSVALDPARSAVVEACAGSGKTWLLVSRMIRLLLAGAEPSSLLAITFTRKAAEEMRERLYRWLEDLALQPEDTVIDFLVQRRLKPEAAKAALPCARGLFEQVLMRTPGPMITTFHGWFLHLLAHAPLQARGPSQLVEDAALTLREAWLTFAESLGSRPESAQAQALHGLLTEFSLSSVRDLLYAFVSRRAEWWSWAAGQSDPVEATMAVLEGLSGVTENEDILGAVLADAGFVHDLLAYQPLLARQTAGSRRDAHLAQTLDEVLAHLSNAQGLDTAQHLTLWQRLTTVFLSQAGSPRQWRDGTTLRQRLGQADADRFLDLHARLAAHVRATQAKLAEQRAIRFNRWALTAGVGLLEQYQRLKAERDQLDFTDAEWAAWRLLADEETGPALLARLDRRWRHILLDEFQDTNPLQWQCLRAWLDAYGLEGERPTLFLVGDPKQSIYRFRRAEPRLFTEVAAWLERNWGAVVLPNATTRRLAPRVTAWVNAVFADQADYPGFHPHVAHAADLPGLCEVIRVPRPIAPTQPSTGLRDPLTQPPPADLDLRAVEAQAVAERIRALVGRLLIRTEDGERPARYGDILLLTASRTGLEAFEQAFKAADIPFIGTRRGGLLDTLEASDLIALLTWLTRPGDDLALAQVLRSPLFAWEDTDLLALSARTEARWHERLMAWAQVQDAPPHVRHAARRLTDWLAQAGREPAHDLLDRIFHEGEVEARYAAAAPAHLRAGVLANLKALLALSLELAGGRYPSLPRFLDELTALRDHAGEEAPDEPPAAGVDAVRLMTIHAAKGLEAPIVFLIKADDPGRDQDHYGVLVDWPAMAARPAHFSLYGRKDWRGDARAALFAQEQALQARERLNLLYVAMTRARQALFICGLDTAKANPDNWLTRAAEGLERAALDALPAMTHGAPAAAAAPRPVIRSQPSPSPLGSRRAPPSPAAQQGIAIHRYLELACRGWDEAAIAQDLALSPADFAAVRARAQALLTAPRLRRFFDPAQYRAAYNELVFVDRDGQLRRIDRLVDFGDEIWVLDYKTGEPYDTDPERPPPPARDQLAAYRAAMARLYPGRRLRAALIFADASLLELLPD